jgi:hypothetical protein
LRESMGVIAVIAATALMASVRLRVITSGEIVIDEEADPLVHHCVLHERAKVSAASGGHLRSEGGLSCHPLGRSFSVAELWDLI